MVNLWVIYGYSTGILWVIITGWWLNPTPLKNMKVNWDDELPNIWKNKK